MIVIILCGGNGTRLEDYSLPKPLNLINGRPAIFYTLNNLPTHIDTIHFIVAPHLIKYNFDTIVINEFRSKKCIFHNLAYFTRGAIESALLGSLDIISTEDESIVFLDNDVIFEFPDTFFTNKLTSFLGYSKDNTENESFSFLKLNDAGYVIDYKEKKRISDMFCCGVYGFKNMKQFRQLSYDILINNDSTNTFEINKTNELYMSLLFNKMLSSNELIKGIEFTNNILHIGSLKELKASINYINYIKTKKMRICFDLDNTLVSYPTIPYDYSSVKPIDNMIQFAQKLKSEGHTIIIHTARRMATHNNNVGAVIKDIGKQTFETLDLFNIPYDELLFGKPIADIYIDDKSANPYRKGSIQSMGCIDYEDTEEIINMLPNNKYNSIKLIKDKTKIIKSGLKHFLSGELFFYKNIPKYSSISNYFPIFYGSNYCNNYCNNYDSNYGGNYSNNYFINKNSDTIINNLKDEYKNTDNHNNTINIILEYIPNIPIYTLYKSNLLTIKHINQIIEFLDILHNLNNLNILPSLEDIKSNYIDKLKTRFLCKEDYPFDNAEEIQLKCINNLEDYFNNNSESIKHNNIVSYIHGDCWFSNILLDYKSNLKFIDMKGQVNNKLTTGGDIMYDYGKLYQSILGYDAILYGDSINSIYSNKIREEFENILRKKNINICHLKIITFSLVIGTLHSIKTLDIKHKVWLFIINNFLSF